MRMHSFAQARALAREFFPTWSRRARARWVLARMRAQQPKVPISAGWSHDLRAYGYEVLPSQTNFFMVSIGREIQPVILEFQQRKVLVGRLPEKFPSRTRRDHCSGNPYGSADGATLAASRPTCHRQNWIEGRKLRLYSALDTRSYRTRAPEARERRLPREINH